jgi:tagatose-6-phosphate ketose/aldose isomerase
MSADPFFCQSQLADQDITASPDSANSQDQAESYLGHSRADLQQQGAYWTAREISQQPQIWQQIADEHQHRLPALHQFLQPLLAQPDLRIILTGAGTSAYIGQALAASLQQQLLPGQRVEAIATTDLVSAPGLYLKSPHPTLLVSYGRSGNSPESFAAVQLAEQLLPACWHLIITCNTQGQLAQFSRGLASPGLPSPGLPSPGQAVRSYLYALPEATHDQSFAMTSSFSAMYLATKLCFANDSSAVQQLVDCLVKQGKQLLNEQLTAIRAQAQTACRRMVFLGSGPLLAIAREAALKYLELSAGQILSYFESPLGFRHGPKSLVDADTQLILLQSADPYTRQYDLDLYAELQRDKLALRIDMLTVQQFAATEPQRASAATADLLSADGLTDDWLGLLHVLWCQTLACYKAMQLGVAPDNPCPGGQVNRVVQGVVVHPYGGKP